MMMMIVVVVVMMMAMMMLMIMIVTMTMFTVRKPRLSSKARELISVSLTLKSIGGNKIKEMKKKNMKLYGNSKKNRYA